MKKWVFFIFIVFLFFRCVHEKNISFYLWEKIEYNYKHKNFNETKKMLKKFIKKYSENPVVSEAYYRLGKLYLKRNKKLAKKYFNKCLYFAKIPILKKLYKKKIALDLNEKEAVYFADYCPIKRGNNFKKWSLLSMRDIDKSNYLTLGKNLWKGTNDLKLSFAVVYDMTNLYFLCRIKDNILSFNKDKNMLWDGDSIEIYLDFNNQEVRNKYYNTNTFHLIIVPSADGLIDTSHHIIKDFKLYYIINNNEYIIKLCIPLKNFPLNKVKNCIGFDIGVNDRDNKKHREKQMMWFGTADNWKTPAFFGKLYLRGGKNKI